MNSSALLMKVAVSTIFLSFLVSAAKIQYDCEIYVRGSKFMSISSFNNSTSLSKSDIHFRSCITRYSSSQTSFHRRQLSNLFAEFSKLAISFHKAGSPSCMSFTPLFQSLGLFFSRALSQRWVYSWMGWEGSMMVSSRYMLPSLSTKP